MKLNSKLLSSLLQFIKFNIVGLFNTALTYGVYSLTVYITDNHFLAITIDYAVGITTSFVLNKTITFKNKDAISLSMIGKMILSYMPSLFMNIVLLHILVDKLLWNKYLAQLVIAVFIALISFFLLKKIVFKEKNH